MVITNHGYSFFKVSLGDTVLALNPPAKSSNKKSSRFGADVAMSSLKHEDFSGGSLLTAGDKEPFVITGPGEYEVQGIFITGHESKSDYGGESRINTIYTFELDQIDVCFLGALNAEELKPDTQEAIGDVDIVFVPVGGEDSGVLSPTEAEKLAVKLEPHIIIPMVFNDDTEPLDAFLKEAGASDVEPADKLTVKTSDLSGKEGEVVVIEES